MKIICEKNLLLENINIVQKAVSSKSNIAVLEGILISANDNIKLTGNNLDMGIEAVIDANILEKGQVVLNAKMFSDIIRNMPDGLIEINTNPMDFSTVIINGKTKFEIKGLNSDEFPEISSLNKDNYIKIKENILRSMIHQTLFAIGTNENKFILTGSLFEINNNELNLVSVDGFRLAIRKEKIDETGKKINFVIPGKTLTELSKLLKESTDVVNIFYSEKQVMFEIDNYVLVSRLLEGEFLNYTQILPRDYELKVKINTHLLVRAIERVSLIISSEDNNKSPAILNISNDEIAVSCNSSLGNVTDSVPAEVNGYNLEIGFNYKYILDALKATETDSLFLEFNTHLSPCVIKPIQGEEFLYIVLPVRLKNE